MGKVKIALVLSNASPTRYATYSSLANLCGDLHMFLCTSVESGRPWKEFETDEHPFKAKILPGYRGYIRAFDWGLYFNPTIINELIRLKPTHIIVHGYENPTYIAAILFAKMTRTPLVIWWGSHALSTRMPTGPVAELRKILLRLGDTYITYGIMASQFLQTLGIERKRIVSGVNTVDVEKIGSIADEIRRSVKHTDRPAVPLRLLYVGRFTEGKGILRLFMAISLLPRKLVKLTVVGYGHLKSKLQSFANEHNLDNVEIVGPTKATSDTVGYYALSDALIMPSLFELWGLVVNEALACGLYVLTSRYAGVSLDLIERAPYRVGSIIDPLNIPSMAREIEKTAQMFRNGEVDQRQISLWGRAQTPEKYARAVYEALLRSEEITKGNANTNRTVSMTVASTKKVQSFDRRV